MLGSQKHPQHTIWRVVCGRVLGSPLHLDSKLFVHEDVPIKLQDP